MTEPKVEPVLEPKDDAIDRKSDVRNILETAI